MILRSKFIFLYEVVYACVGYSDFGNARLSRFFISFFHTLLLLWFSANLLHTTVCVFQIIPIWRFLLFFFFLTCFGDHFSLKANKLLIRNLLYCLKSSHSLIAPDRYFRLLVKYCLPWNPNLCNAIAYNKSRHHYCDWVINPCLKNEVGFTRRV